MTIKNVHVSENEIFGMKRFVTHLNQKDSIVVVEGKKDTVALRKIGYTGKIMEFHKFGGMTKFVDSAATYTNLTILLDGDRKGRYLTGKIIEKLSRRTKLSLAEKKRLNTITGGKVRFIEQLVSYEPYMI